MAETVLLTSRLRDVVGGRTSNALEKAFGIETVHDLLLHVPRRYSNRGELTDLAALREGELVTVMAQVKSVGTRPMRQRRGTLTEVVVTDGSRDLSLTFFRKPWGSRIEVGAVGLFAGKASSYRGKLQLTHPECHMLPVGGDEQDALDFAGQIIPVYPASASVSTWVITRAVAMALDQVTWIQQPDPIAADIRERVGLVDMAAAYEGVHRPQSDAEISAGQRRIRFEEALALQTILLLRRRLYADAGATVRRRIRDGLLAEFDERLPFVLTKGQHEVGEVIFEDLSAPHPMHRLLQGEVGSGKTLVALRAMLAVVDAGGQAALLAPTEVLARQHARAIAQLLGPLAEAGLFGSGGPSTKVALLTGSATTAHRRQTLLDIASGEAGIVIGTHALLSENVTFADLGLVVVDEQHRFGVEQRAALVSKAPDGRRPHVLVMTATPIPRTVAITVFGDLDISTLRELPAGRAPISTFVVPGDKPQFVERTWQRIREEIAAGRQAYVVCPRISEDLADEGEVAEFLDAETGNPLPESIASVEHVSRTLAEGPLQGLRIATIHGRMPADEMQATMRRFAENPEAPDGIDVLVSTTVIEVGVDVPNATVMVVMDADRFGISQLHQLRGRVGRGQHPGLCLLVTNSQPDTDSRERLEAVASTTDGFELSKLDLKSRREGDVLGADQSGNRSSLRALSLLRDADLIAEARHEAERIVDADPMLGDHPALAELAREMAGPDAGIWLERS